MSSDQASDIQQRMYKFIVRYMKSEKMPPTNREIGREMQIASTGHVDFHLSMLEKKGLILRQPKKSRGIKIIMQSGNIAVRGAITDGQPLDIFANPNDETLSNEDHYALVVKGQSMIED